MYTFQVVTEIGDDIVNSGMLTYDDVELVGAAARLTVESHDLFNQVHFIIATLSQYLDHPVPAAPTRAQQVIKPSQASSIEEPAEDVTTLTSHESSRGIGPSTTIIAVVLSVIAFVMIVAIVVTIALCRERRKFCYPQN